MIQSFSDQKSCLLQILTCLICQQKAIQAHVCPNCSKFYCYTCITKQISKNQSKCPYCMEFLVQEQLINCHKLCMDLSNAMENIDIKKQKQKKADYQICQDHNLKKNYYCQTCNKSLCSDCSILSEQHRGHEFIKLSSAKKRYQKNVSNIKKSIQEIKKKVEYQISNESNRKKDFQHQIDLVIKEFNNHIKYCEDKISKRYNTESKQFQKLIQKQKQSTSEANQFYEKTVKQINNYSKVLLISSKGAQFQKIINQNYQKISTQNSLIQSYLTDHFKKAQENEILPSDQSYCFKISNYSQLCLKNDVLYTQIFKTDGLEWRLKIYPLGNNQQTENNLSNSQKNIASNEKYISIFIELVKGLRHKGHYRYQVTILNLKNPKLKVSREFSSQFQDGQCWGYDKFTKLNYLIQNGFLNDEIDELQIILNIGAVNYCELNLDMMELNKLKTQKLVQKREEVKKLKEQLERLEIKNV